MVLGKGRAAPSAAAAIEMAYAKKENDEFIQPSVMPGYQGIAPDDVMFSFNFRKDRPKQLVAALARQDFQGFDRGSSPLAAVTCMMKYDNQLGLPYAFESEHPKVTLNRQLSQQGVAQFHCAETEKYAHVTHFFNGGRSEPAEGEKHLLIPSPKVATYDLCPEMSAEAVADAVLKAIASRQYGFILVNFANGDMVGHTGMREATLRAVETLDTQAGRVLDAAVAAGYSALLTADHGNCDLLVDPVTDAPHTQHTTYPVPCLVVDHQRWRLASRGGLANVAPTVLQLMGLEIPSEMALGSVLQEALPEKTRSRTERYAA
jgi:2,3-bisphosphoglycerate-independent phosphoglycerate mutase